MHLVGSVHVLTRPKPLSLPRAVEQGWHSGSGILWRGRSKRRRLPRSCQLCSNPGSTLPVHLQVGSVLRAVVAVRTLKVSVVTNTTPPGPVRQPQQRLVLPSCPAYGMSSTAVFSA